MIGFLKERHHKRLRELLSAYIDGEVSAAEARAVEAHMGGCASCREELSTLRATVGILRGLPQLDVPRSFALREAPAQRRSTPPLVWTTRLATSVAAMLLVALFVGDWLGLIAEPAEIGDAAASAPEMMRAAQSMEPFAPAAPAPQPFTAASAPSQAEVAETPQPQQPAAPAPAPAPTTAPAAPPQSQEMTVQQGATVQKDASATPQAEDTTTMRMSADRPAQTPQATQTPPPAIAAAPAAPEAGMPPEQDLGPASVPLEAAQASAEEVHGPAPDTREPKGIQLPVRQLQIALGGLLALLAAAMLWMSRRARA